MCMYVYVHVCSCMYVYVMLSTFTGSGICVGLHLPAVLSNGVHLWSWIFVGMFGKLCEVWCAEENETHLGGARSWVGLGAGWS